MTGQCARAEVLAGAVALGEATDAERDEYRRHLTSCSRCVTTLGGERDIERVMSVVAQARDAETWQPDLRSALVARYRQRANHWRWGVSGVVAALVASIGIHAFLAAGIPTSQSQPPVPAMAISYNGMHVTLERRAPAQRHSAMQTVAAQTAAAPADRQTVVVVHNVVTLHQAPVRPVANPTPAPVTAVAKTAAKPVEAGGLGAAATVVAAGPTAPTLHDESSIGALRTAATAQPPAARAESLAVFPNVTTIRDAMPIGGETAIVPKPAPIAYEEGAQGTTAFEVSVDDRGTPTKCTITKPSGYLVLDVSVCNAAMHAHYTPRTINGKPVPGIYRDAFTFREDQ